ncbi:hypothetical protein [Rhodoplanes sp. SY1]|uniref:hypothetical protein n=1 Tax=Rhodoplanes sp. SY1 TaxID=3166646 RepID=UPI0038B4A736
MRRSIVSRGRARCIAAALVVLLSFAAMSTPAEARKIRFSFGASKSVAAPAPVPAPVQTRPAALRPAVYVGVSPRAGVAPGAAGAAPVRAASADGGELARLAGPDATPPARKPPVDERVARRKAWLDFCQPTLSAPDRYGVERWVYAHDGCQFGRTE